MVKIFSLKHICFIVVTCLILYFSAFPLLILVIESLKSGFANYRDILFSKTYGTSLWNTLKLCSLTTLMTVLMGVPLAWILHKTDLPYKKTLKSLLMIPYIIPPYIGAIAWIKLLNPTSGSINMVLKNWLDESPFNIYSLMGATWVLGLFFYNFIVLTCFNAFEKMDPSLEEASLMSGASRFKTLRHITLPLLKPALLAGVLLVFVATASVFGVPALLLMPSRIFVLTTKIYADVIGYSGGLERAISLSVCLMILGLVILGFNTFLLGKKNLSTVSGKYHYFTPLSLGKWKWVIFTFILALWSLSVLLPLGTIFTTSFLKIYGEAISLSNLTLAKYQYVLFQLPATLRAFTNSFIYAGIAASIAVIVGFLIAYMKVQALDFLSMLPYALPGAVIAMGFIMAYSGSHGLNLYNTMWILISAYVIKNITLAVRNHSAELKLLDKSLEEAATMSGASWYQMIYTVVLPLVKPAMIASWFLIFMPTFSDLTMSVFLVGPNTETIGTLLYNLQSYDDPQSAAVLATCIVVVILVANGMVKKITQGKYGV